MNHFASHLSSFRLALIKRYGVRKKIKRFDFVRPINCLPTLEFTNDFASLLPSHLFPCSQRSMRPAGIAYPLALFKHLIKFSRDFISAFRRKAKTERKSFSRNLEFEVRCKCAVGDTNSGQLERYRRESAGCNQPAKPR